MDKHKQMGSIERFDHNFVLPEGLIGRFAIVKLWPELKTAEDECIARIKLAAEILGISCVEIHADGRLLDSPKTYVTQKDVDFVLHLHYDTPKYYDVFSFVALWNPLDFYHQWGYRRTSRNLLTHDDFISCSSDSADDHVARMIKRTATHMSPLFKLYHSTPDILREPSLGDRKLFYVGINWEAVNGGKSRHQAVLRQLDMTGQMRIYGPKIFLKTEVWKGYQSYVREIPFDGVSMIADIASAGISLVLSSAAHKSAELMSNRLFESVAAGALVICDENKFARRYFGDALLYIDTRESVDVICRDIQTHLDWVNANPDAALAKIKKSQDIFRAKFSLVRNVRDLYLGLQGRKQALLAKQGLKSGEPQLQVGLYLLFPEFSADVLQQHIASVAAQSYASFSATLVVDREALLKHKNVIESAIAKSGLKIEVRGVLFQEPGPTANSIVSPRNTGAIIQELLAASNEGAVVFVAPNETLFSNHLQLLAGSLMRDPQRQCVASAAIVKDGDAPVHGVQEYIEFGLLDPNSPIGFARFMFRTNAMPTELDLALPYLHHKPMAALIGDGGIHQEIPATVIIDVEQEFPKGDWSQEKENGVLSGFCLAPFKVYSGFVPELPPIGPRPKLVRNATPLVRFSAKWFRYQFAMLAEKGVMHRILHLKTK